MSSEREKHSKTAQGLAELLQNVGVSLTDFAMKLTEQSGNVMSALLASGEGFSAEVLGSLLEDLQVPPVLDAEASSYVISSFLDGDGPRLNESDGSKDMADDKELPHLNLDEGTWTCVCTMHVPLSEATCTVCEYYYEDVIDTQAFKDANPEDLGDEGDDDEDDESGGKDIAKGGDGVFADYSDSDRSWAVTLPEDKSQADVETVDEPRRAQFLRLKSYFLSEEFGAQLLKEEEASSAKSSEDHKAKKLIKESEARAFAYKLIPDIDRFLDRREEAPALNLVLLTLRNGLPLYEKFPAIQQHTIRSMQFIFDQLMNHLKENIARSYLQRLVDSFRACQAEQARVIDSIYGSLSGRDKTLKQQLLNLIDDHKERVLEQTVLALNPGAISQDDSVPQKQLPHIRSSYRISAGPRLGLGHIQSAKVDYCKFRICAEHRQLVIDAYLRLFLLHDLLDVFVNDVNQQDPEAERLIDIDLLTKWAGNKEENNGFDAYSIYYDETQPKLYNDAKPLEQNAYQPFLSRHVALDILTSLFLSSPLSGSSSAASV